MVEIRRRMDRPPDAPILFCNRFAEWASGQADILAVALVGSYARGTAGPESDVDLVIITDQPEKYMRDDEWLARFGAISRIQEEDWGLVQSRRCSTRRGLRWSMDSRPRGGPRSIR